MAFNLTWIYGRFDIKLFAENQVLKQIEKIKRGDFSEEFQSVKLSMIQDYGC